MLGKVVSENQRDWDNHVAYVLAAYNATEHSATGYSPNMLVYGRELRFPNELMYTDVDECETMAVSSIDFVAERQELFKKAFAIAREMLGNTAERSKKRLDMQVKTTAYDVGDWVYYFCPRHRVGRSPKWQRFYSGPFLVVEKLGAVNLRIQKSPRANAIIVHLDKVKHCMGDTPVSWLGRDDYNIVPPILECDALPIMFGDVDRSAPDSADDETRRRIITRPKRKTAVPARYLNRIYAVPMNVLSDELVLTHINRDDNRELMLYVIITMTKTTQRPERFLIKCQRCDEEEDRDCAYTRSYDLVAHLVNKHKLYLISIRHNAPYLAVRSDLRPATAEEAAKHKDANNHRRKKMDERASTGEASASGTTVEPEAPVGPSHDLEVRKKNDESTVSSDKNRKRDSGHVPRDGVKESGKNRDRDDARIAREAADKKDLADDEEDKREYTSLQNKYRGETYRTQEKNRSRYLGSSPSGAGQHFAQIGDRS